MGNPGLFFSIFGQCFPIPLENPYIISEGHFSNRDHLGEKNHEEEADAGYCG